ncbi:MAG: PspC domain-containing protein [Sphaerochaetaceae bacterium]|jgi:phage shock protein C|nr:PspC domain-containing protein [Sphaerochaetaceae bacterium]
MSHNNRLRRSSEGKLLGVCQGLADWIGINPTVVRIAVVVIAFATSFFPVLCAYLAAAILMPQPARY